MKIVDVTQENFENFFCLAHQMIKQSVFADVEPSKEKLLALALYPKARFFLANQGDQAVGFAGACVSPFYFSTMEKASDIGLYVVPKYRGGSVACRLIKRLEKWAKDMGHQKLYMGQSVGLKVDKTLSFFERNGYQVLGFNCVKDI